MSSFNYNIPQAPTSGTTPYSSSGDVMGRISFPDAVAYIFEKTWPVAKEHPWDFVDCRRAWMYYLEDEYGRRTASYGGRPYNRTVPLYRVKRDLEELLQWLRSTPDDDIMEVMDASLVHDSRLRPLHLPREVDADAEVMSDFLKQATMMTDAVLCGEKIDIDAIDLRIADLKQAMGRLSPAKQRKFKNAYEKVLVKMGDAKEILGGNLEPINADFASDSHIFKDRDKVGSEMWDRWLEMFQFVAGERKGQDGYSPKKERVIQRFRDMGSRIGTDDEVVCEPREVVRDPHAVTEILLERDEERKMTPDDLKGVSEMYDLFLG